jgi:hypothetical protein
MKEFKIDPKVEKQVEAMFALASQMRDLKSKYLNCYNIIRREFQLETVYGNTYVEHDSETVKMDLYVEVHKQNEKERLQKKKAIESKLKT